MDRPVQVDSSRKAFTTVDQRVQSALPPDDFRKIADARRAMWNGGFVGLGGGICLGISLFILRRRFGGADGANMTLGKHGLLFALLGGSSGSFIGTTSFGTPAMKGLNDGTRSCMISTLEIRLHS